MIHVVTKQTTHIIQSGLLYWQDILSQQEPSLPRLQKEGANLQQVLLYGAKTYDTWEQTAVLALELSPYIEKNLNWDEWIPILNSLIRKAPIEHELVTLQLMIQLGNLYRLSDKIDLAKTSHTKSITLAKNLEESFHLAMALRQLAYDYLKQGLYKQAHQLALESEPYFIQHNEPVQLAKTYMQLGTINRLLGNLLRAEKQITTAHLYCDPSSQPLLTARVAYEMGNIYEQLEKIQKASQAYHSAETLFIKTDNIYDLCRLYIGWGTLHHNLQDYDKAHEIFQRADREYLIISGHIFLLAYLENNTGANLVMMGDAFTAVPYLNRAINYWQRLENPLMESISIGMLAKANRLEGNQQLAISNYSKAISILESKNVDGFFKDELIRLCQDRSKLQEVSEGVKPH